MQQDQHRLISHVAIVSHLTGIVINRIQPDTTHPGMIQSKRKSCSSRCLCNVYCLILDGRMLGGCRIPEKQ